jgi:hypothetical protein
MEAVHFTNLLVVVALAFLGPWVAPGRSGPWQATGFTGAKLSYVEILDSVDQR